MQERGGCHPHIVDRVGGRDIAECGIRRVRSWIAWGETWGMEIAWRPAVACDSYVL